MIRLKVSVIAVDYGLNRLGDFKAKCLLLGDHSDGVLETTADGYTSDTRESSESETDVDM